MFFSRFSPKIEDLNLVNKLSELDTLFDPYPWKLDHWRAIIDSKDEAIFILQDKDLLGWAVFKLIPSDSLAHLLKLLIHPDFRRKGYGEDLLKRSISELEKDNYLKFYLEVEKGNPAIFIYQRLGFTPVHEISNFYGQGRNAIAMSR
jgi:ribosomal protein S18 acetylase RimI-like enzyme